MSQSAVATEALAHLDVRLLVAEDNAINQKVIEQQLKVLGYVATMSADGVEALDAWREGDFQLVLTDCNMPNMDGYELSRRIRDEEQQGGDGRHVPIVALTANAHVGEEAKCLGAGMDALLTKPTDIQKLDQTLSRFLDGEQISGEQADTFTSTRKLLLIDRAGLKTSLGGEPSLVAGVLVQFRALAEEADGYLAEHADDPALVRRELVRLSAAAHAVHANPLATLCDAFPNDGATDKSLKDLRALLMTTARQIRPV